MPARHAQSSMLPPSDRKWNVSLRCQTLKRNGAQYLATYEHALTRWPARTHSDSLSIVSLRRRILSSMRVISTSCSLGLQHGNEMHHDEECVRAHLP